MSHRDKGEDPIADVLLFGSLDERGVIVGTSAAGTTHAPERWVERLLETGARVSVVDRPGLRASADENLAEAAIPTQLDAGIDLRDHVDDLAAAEPPKGFRR